MTYNDTTLIALVFAAAFLAAWAIKLYLWKWLEGRRDSLEIAKMAWEQHERATLSFLDDPAPSYELKTLLATLSCSIGTRGVASNLAKHLFAQTDTWPTNSRNLSNESLALIEEIDQLRTSRHDLVELFDEAFLNGMVALFHRWPETRSMFARFEARIGAKRSNKVIIADRISKMIRTDGKNDNFPDVGNGSVGQMAHCA